MEPTNPGEDTRPVFIILGRVGVEDGAPEIPVHILLRAAWHDAGEGLLDIRRLGELLRRVKGQIRHMDLERISPFAVPVMLNIDKVPVRTGDGIDAILEEASEASLIAEAMGQPR